MALEWYVEVEARTSIGTHICFRLIALVGRIEQHSHSPEMQAYHATHLRCAALQLMNLPAKTTCLGMVYDTLKALGCHHTPHHAMPCLYQTTLQQTDIPDRPISTLRLSKVASEPSVVRQKQGHP